MDTKIYNGDFKLNSTGLTFLVDGNDELLQQVLIRLCVKRGSFVHDKNLGSDLHLLRAMPQEMLKKKALSYVTQALSPMKNIQVVDVQVSVDSLGLVVEKVLVKLKNANRYSNLEVVL